MNPQTPCCVFAFQEIPENHAEALEVEIKKITWISTMVERGDWLGDRSHLPAWF
jgi:hypothetical protein